MIMQTPIYAMGFGEIPEFNNLSGDAQYIRSDYRNNYQLDIEKTGMLDVGDKMFNAVANILFFLVTNISYVVCAVFYFSMQLDIPYIFSKHIDGIQAALRGSVFEPLFLLAFAASAFSFVKQLIRRNFTGLLTDIFKVIFILLLSFLVVTKSADTLSNVIGLTKNIAVSALKNINDAKSTDFNPKSFAAESAGLIWKSLVHNVWLSLEFGKTDIDEGTVKEFLTVTDPVKREKLVEDYRAGLGEDDKNIMAKSTGIGRIGFLIVYLIPLFVNSAVYLIISVIQLAFQIMAIFFVLLAPVILLLSLVPAFGGFDLLSNWTTKIIETQLSILVITFLLGLLLKFNQLLYDRTAEYGWFGVIVIQTLIMVIVVLNRSKILKSLSGIHKMQNSPHSMRYKMRNADNIYQAAERLESRKPKRKPATRKPEPAKPISSARKTKTSANTEPESPKDNDITSKNTSQTQQTYKKAHKDTPRRNTPQPKKENNVIDVEFVEVASNPTRTKNENPNQKGLSRPQTRTTPLLPKPKDENLGKGKNTPPSPTHPKMRLNQSSDVQGQKHQATPEKSIVRQNTRPERQDNSSHTTEQPELIISRTHTQPENIPAASRSSKTKNPVENKTTHPKMRLNRSSDVQGQKHQVASEKSIVRQNTRPERQDNSSHTSEQPELIISRIHSQPENIPAASRSSKAKNSVENKTTHPKMRLNRSSDVQGQKHQVASEKSIIRQNTRPERHDNSSHTSEQPEPIISQTNSHQENFPENKATKPAAHASDKQDRKKAKQRTLKKNIPINRTQKKKKQD